MGKIYENWYNIHMSQISTRYTTEIKDAGDFLASAITKKLGEGKKVLLFLTGGSSIAVGIALADILRKSEIGEKINNLTITLTDERYGPVEHFNSNLFQLKEKGFDLPGANIVPVLVDDDRDITTEKFNNFLKEELAKAEYKIGLFGVGADGHTAGILPESVAVDTDKFAIGYDTPVFSRITITPKTIEKLDEAVVWMQGKDKWPVLESLQNEIPIQKQPAQVLKKIPLLTIFSDKK